MNGNTALLRWPGHTAPEVVLALDYDGTLREIVPRPSDAQPDPGLVLLLAELAAESGLHTVILSGRALEELERWLPARELWLAGSHGAEWRPAGGEAEPLLAPGEARETVRAATLALEDALAGIPGSEVEAKGLSVAAHCRNVEPRYSPLWRDRFSSVARRFSDRLEVQRGKEVRELCWRGVEKGKALEEIRRRRSWGDLPVLAIGDDLTDETVFTSLAERDLAIHVGDAASAAQVRVRDVTAVRALLRTLLNTRRARSPETHA